MISLHSGVFESFTVPWVKTSDTSRGTTTDNPIVIEDAVEDIFVYVCQYLYTGDYSIPLPDDVVPYHIGEDKQHEQNNTLMLKGSIFENSASVKKLADYTVRGIQPWPTLPSNGHHYHHFWNYSRALLAHAQLNSLNVFAGKYELEEKKKKQLSWREGGPFAHSVKDVARRRGLRVRKCDRAERDRSEYTSL